MSREVTKMTLASLRTFLNEIPSEFDEYSVVNGEVFVIPEEDGTYKFYARVDKPVMSVQLDEQTKELCILHQPEEEIEEILAKLEDPDEDGTTEETEG